MKKLLLIFTFVFLLFSFPSPALAVVDPLSVPNNKVGIHIFSEKDLDDAARLVNANGDWGYVTFVITESERNHDRWQQIFDQMRRLHLIPIVRIATKADGGTWELPKEEEINNWVGFLNSLNWVTENRYVVIANEPNHNSEWGGKVDPSGYASYLKQFSEKLKAASPDFFILPAGLDASAKNSTTTMEESKFIKEMVVAEPSLFDLIDGWTSHSYPNPDFSGKETDTGKGSIDTFGWELTYLKSLGLQKDLPVFITETGWSNKSLDENTISERLIYAYQNVWNNQKVVAVTPFILNYPQEPFGVFSWKKSDGTFYAFFNKVRDLQKVVGRPVQIESGQILAAFAQPIIPVGADYAGAILAKNTGQSIWNENQNSLNFDNANLKPKSYSFNDIEPMRLGLIVFKAASPQNTGVYSQSLFLTGSKGQRITNSFPIEAVLVKINWNEIGSYLNNILSNFKIKN